MPTTSVYRPFSSKFLAIRLWWTSTHHWVVSWNILLPHLTQLCTIPGALNLDPPGTLMLIRQMMKGFWDGPWRVGARFQPKTWKEQLHNKWELSLWPPCHQSKIFWRLFSQFSSLSCRFGMIAPGHGTGCEHPPIEFRRVSRMQKAGSPEDSEHHRKKGRVKSSYHLCLQH